MFRTSTTRWPRATLLTLLAVVCGVVYTLLALATGTLNAASADEPRFERTYVENDSLVVGASWNKACDVLGCADQYRVTWAASVLPTTSTPRTNQQIRDSLAKALNLPPGSPAELPRAFVQLPTDADDPSLASQPVSKVLLDTTVTEPRSRVKIALPALPGAPTTVCLYVTAVRRGKASTATSACRTIERPDAAPPPVDSIKWDSLDIVTDTTQVYPRLIESTFTIENSGYQYQFAWSEDSVQAELRDSAPLQRFTDPQGRNGVLMYRGWVSLICASVQDKDGGYWVIVPDAATAWTPGMLRNFKNRCGNTPRMVASGKPVRFFRDQVQYDVIADYGDDVPDQLRQRHTLSLMEGMARLTPGPVASPNAPVVWTDPLLSITANN